MQSINAMRNAFRTEVYKNLVTSHLIVFALSTISHFFCRHSMSITSFKRLYFWSFFSIPTFHTSNISTSIFVSSSHFSAFSFPSLFVSCGHCTKHVFLHPIKVIIIFYEVELHRQWWVCVISVMISFNYILMW